MFDPAKFVHPRAHLIDASGIRKVFDLAANMKDPINLSIGQPDFDTPEPLKLAAIKAIVDGRNSYTVTQGLRELKEKIQARIRKEFPLWSFGPQGACESLVTSGVSGGLVLAMLACVGPGDEILIADPYFVMYKHLVNLVGGTPVQVDTYPDFQLTAERLERHVTPRTKMILFNSPSNPTGVVATEKVCQEVVDLAERRGLLLLSDEIYDEFCYAKVLRDGVLRCPSPASFSPNLLLLRGFSKTYGMTGWRMGYAAGPKAILEQMTKLQQYTFVCAPSMVQYAGLAALDQDMSQEVAAYRRKRDRVVEKLSPKYELSVPEGAFYAFPKAPAKYATATAFVEEAIRRQLLIIPGNVFSSRDTHFRISYACDDAKLDRGLDILLDLA